jgi:hypothetical protein
MADSMNSQGTAGAACASSRRFPRKRTLAALAVLAFAGLALAPTIISHTKLRNLVLRVILPVHGTATAEHGSLGWFSPIWLGGAVVRDEAGQPVLEAEELSLGRTLLELAWNPRDLGPLSLKNPRLKSRMADGSLDVARVFGPLFDAPPDEAASLTGFEIVNGTIDFVDPAQGIELQLAGLTLSIDSTRPKERIVFQVAGDLTVLKPDSAGLYQPPVTLAGGGRYEVAADELTLKGLKIAPRAGPFACRAEGRIAGLTKQPMLELAGELEYDLPQLADRLRPYVGGDLQLVGRDVRPFRISGPLADPYEDSDAKPEITRVAWQGQTPPPEPNAEAAAEEAKKRKTGDPYGWLKKLGAEANLAWKSASGFGVEVGEATLKGQLLKGWLDLASTPIDVADGKIDLKTRLNLATSTPELTIGPGRVADHVRLTPKVCAQGLRFIAPVLANATEVEGRFSLDVDECSIPLTQGRQPVVKGALSIHNVDVAATGPLVKQIAEVLRVEPRARLVRESVVEFEMIGNRVHHKGLEFQLANIRVLTHGSVGLDESLDLVAEFPIPDAWLGPGLIGQQLRGQAVRMPVGGTLRKPQIDVKALAHMNVGILGDTGEALRGVIDGEPILPEGVGDLLEGLLERRKARLTQPGQPEPSTPLLDLIRDRRKQRQARPPVTPVPPGPREF